MPMKEIPMSQCLVCGHVVVERKKGRAPESSGQAAPSECPFCGHVPLDGKAEAAPEKEWEMPFTD
jgi:hypothetical protein